MNNYNNEAYIKMGWRYVSYTDNEGRYIFPIEPMYEECDIVYLPINKEDCKNVLDIIQSIPWNRKLVYKDADYKIKKVNINDPETENGSLETTQAGIEFLALNMFNQDFELDQDKVHELWCNLEKRFAENAEGKVTIVANSIVEGSVFEKVSLPTLMRNDKVTLFFEGK